MSRIWFSIVVFLAATLMVRSVQPAGLGAIALLQEGAGIQDGAEPKRSLTEADRRYLQNQIQRIEAARQQGNFTRAANLAERLVERMPDFLRGWMLLAEIHLTPNWPMRNDSRAESAAEAALALGGRQPPLLYALATAKYHQRRTEEAFALIAELVDSVPPASLPPTELADLLVARASMRRESADAKVQAFALADLDRALKVAPGYAPALLERAEHRYLAGDKESALSDLESIKDRLAGARKLHFLLYKCYKSLGRKEQAARSQRIFQCILRLTDSVSAVSAPGPEERLSLLRELWALNPTDSDRCYQRVDLEIVSGHLEEARSALAELRRRFLAWPAIDHLQLRLDKKERGESLEEADGDGG